MVKKIDIKHKKLIVIIIVALFTIATIATLSVLLTTPRRVPEADVVEVLGEPDYLIKIEWDKTVGANIYEVEYCYALYPEEIHSVETEDTYVYIDRVKGNLSFRIRALSSNGIKSSDFSEWKEFEVPALRLPILFPFSFIHLDEGWKVDYNFSAVNYEYKGEIKTVNFYEVSDNYNEGNIDILSWNEIQNFIFSFPEGEIIYRFRPVIFTYFNGMKINEPVELYNLYEEVTPYVEVSHINVE